MIKESVQEEDITVANMYASNIEVPQYIRQTLAAIKGETDSNTVIVENFSILLIPMDRSSRQKVNKETSLKWHNRAGRLIDIYRTFYPKAAEYTFLLSAYGTLSRINHIMDHKSSPVKLTKTEIVSRIFFWPQCYEIRNQLQEEKKNKLQKTQTHEG